MNDHAVSVLEFDRIREILSSYTVTGLGRQAALKLKPKASKEEIQESLDQAQEMGRLIDVARLPLAGFQDVAGTLRSLAEGGRPGEPELLYNLLTLLRGSLSLRETLTRDSKEFPVLSRLGEKFEDAPDLRHDLEEKLDSREGIRDEATEKLFLIRRELRELRDKVRSRIQRMRGESRLQKALQSEGVKFKNDRYLLSVKAEFRQHVKGVIRDRSTSGSTLYIEPQELVEDGDKLLNLLDDERDEVQRILWDLTRAALLEEKKIQRIQDHASKVDLAYAKCRYARSFNLSYPEVVDEPEQDQLTIELQEARHPYLMWLQRDTNKELAEDHFEYVKEKVVPLNIRLGTPYRLVIITGPNTGGKTVVLKTIGLAVLMAQCAIPIASQAGARIPLVSDLFVDIGDEQSIEQSLSTFSSHLTHLVEILKTADEKALILLDELGAGTDPLEGAALATSLLNHFKNKGWHAIITTHLTSLKEYAFSNEEVENAAMEFEQKTLEPTYRLVTGIPGRSHALEIAKRIGIDSTLIEEAEEQIEKIQAPTREIIEKMEHSHRKMEKERRRMTRLRQRAQGERRQAEQEREEAQLEREILREEADEMIDTTLREAREKFYPLLKQLQNLPKNLQPVAEDLKWTVELMLTGTPLGAKREEFARSLKKEDEVFIPKFKEKCKVRKINKGERIVTVTLNGIPTQVSFDDVTWISEPGGVGE